MGKRRKKENMLKTSLCLLWLILPGLVSTDVDCVKMDERCHLMYCGETCGEMVIMGPNKTCTRCLAGEYLNDTCCQCMSCEGTYTNSVPNIRYYCQDSREERSTSTASTPTTTTSMPTPHTSTSGPQGTNLPPLQTTAAKTNATVVTDQTTESVGTATDPPYKPENRTEPGIVDDATKQPGRVMPGLAIAGIIFCCIVLVVIGIIVAAVVCKRRRGRAPDEGLQLNGGGEDPVLANGDGVNEPLMPNVNTRQPDNPSPIPNYDDEGL